MTNYSALRFVYSRNLNQSGILIEDGVCEALFMGNFF